MSPEKGKEIRIQGVPVSEGIAIGSPFFLKAIDEDVPDFEITYTEVDSEVARYRKALFSSKEDLTKLRHDLVLEGSDEAVSTIETHIQMLEDPMITTDMEGKIRQMLRNTESVFHSVIRDYSDRFSERTDSFFQERLVDVQDLSKRILGHLRTKQNGQFSDIPSGSIVFTEEVAPSYTASAHVAQISAFVTQSGGGNSHAALIARSKGIPYVADVNVAEIERLNPQSIIVDAYEGLVILSPTAETRAQYKEKQKQLATRYQIFLDEDHLKAETIDGIGVKLYINVGNPQDLDIFPYRHDGVGLFRTEYLFLQSKEFYPSEKYQQEAYANLIAKMQGRPIVVRAFDLGGDKHPGLFLNRQKEPNPVLGNRGIRYLLRNRELFKMQLRALFRAAIGGDVRLLLPLISDINELRISKEIIEEVKEALRQEIPEIPNILVGCMIEVPSAVMISDALAKNCDFLSVGTNDLVQYTLGVDRSNPLMSELYYPSHPSVLRMIKMVVAEAGRQGIPLSICGEIASSTLIIPLLLGLGVRDFSVTPRYLPHIKQTIRKWTVVEAYKLAQHALTMGDPKEISTLLLAAQKR
ncbi:MAG: phosphoenolpyruvate--protein phosphotransferase [Verrucomicrobia bacterium]|nr:phosphoenolpyruvate--protein phosphotransferase [Verrucomicrobiota bacterium]